MPDSYGKRQRDRVKARKAAAKEERRLARQERERSRAVARDAGEPDNESWLAPPEPAVWAPPDEGPPDQGPPDEGPPEEEPGSGDPAEGREP